MTLATEFLSSALKRFREYKSLGEKTFAQLSGEEMLRKPNEASNSIAIIIQHLHGNMLSRWTHFLAEDGEKQWRRRDEEFEVQALNKEQLLAKWDEGWNVLFQAVEGLQEDDLLKTITIRSQPLVVVDAINRQLAHYSYHVGQIVYLGRWMKEAAWQSLSIPKGQSSAYNQEFNKKST